VAIDREKVLAAAQKYVEKKKYDKAVIEYERIIQEDPNDARTLLKMGDLQLKMEGYAAAVATYERVGKFYAQQGFSLKAIAVYKQIREIIGRHVPTLEDKYAHIAPKLAGLYQELGLISDALAALDEVATRLQRQNRDQEAIDVFRKVVDLDTSNPLPHLRLAEALSRAKDVDGAVAEFGTAAGQLLKLGRREDALKVFERLLHHKNDSAHARSAAELYLAKGTASDGMQALAKLQVCFQANPRDLDTLGLLARSFTQIGQAGKAIEVQKEMARIARDTGKVDLFQELVAKLTKLAPNDEGVKRLSLGSTVPPASVQSVRPSAPPPRDQTDPDTDGSASYEDVGEGDIEAEAEEQPIELRRSLEPRALTDSDVVVDSTFEVVEEVNEANEPSTAAGTHTQIARILTDAATLRDSGMMVKAIEALRIGIEIAPRSVEAHLMLRDVLLEMGRTKQAVAQMVHLAELLVEGLDGEAAARMLQEALAVEPDNAQASKMLRELGYELVEDPEGSDDDLDPNEARTAIGVAYDPEAPLPSYDLEEIGPEDVARRSYPDVNHASHAGQKPVAPSHSSARPATRSPHSVEDIDDPFGEPQPLPRFPLDTAPESAAAFELRGGSTAPRGLVPSVQPEAQPPATRSGPPELESALEEADFFASRGLFDDARVILNEQLSRLPNHPLLRERLTELEAQEHGMQGGSGTRPSPAAAEAAAVNDRSFDIAESLGSGEGDGDRASGVGPGRATGSDQVDVEEVFEKFKAGVAEQIPADDAQSHYDLGVAYKEMGLIEDAMREFEMAARDPKRACVCHSMVGTIHLERGNLNEAIDAFQRGLQSPDRTRDQEAALSYEIGAAYEVKRMTKLALDFFQRTARLSPSYRDTQERIRRLQKSEPKQPVRAVAVGADDEFDRAFDDILGGSKS
jgi:tetratricopeptide (TPR) repeat protein